MKFVDQYDDQSFTDPSKDIPNKRAIHLENGRTLNLERRDPYGFVHVVWDKGSPPKALGGVYTTFEKAMQALTLYLNNNTFETIQPQKTEPVQPLQYKKRFRDPVTDENLPINA